MIFYRLFSKILSTSTLLNYWSTDFFKNNKYQIRGLYNSGQYMHEHHKETEIYIEKKDLKKIIDNNLINFCDKTVVAIRSVPKINHSNLTLNDDMFAISFNHPDPLDDEIHNKIFDHFVDKKIKYYPHFGKYVKFGENRLNNYFGWFEDYRMNYDPFNFFI